jgi:poly [ADP-ribose] polymerase 2/3/4
MAVSLKKQLIDEHCSVKGELIEHNGSIYTCTLNQTDVGLNSNKFYIMQLVKSGTTISLYIRYGRTGETGTPRVTAQSSEAEGRTAFEKQFKTKTGNVWGTKNFVKKSGKYFMSEVSYEDELKKIPDIVPIKVPDSKLDVKVQNLIKMLSDINMLKESLVSLEIDTKKMPLGKIKQTQLDKAGDVLNQIQTIVNDIANKKVNLVDMQNQLNNLSSDYYTFLPMSFGRKKPPAISSADMIGKYRDILDELRNMVINIQITENVKSDENPIDAVYKSINTEIKPLDKTSEMWKQIELYVANSHGPTHGIKLEIQEIFEVNQFGKKEKFENHCKNIGNRALLIHGSPMSCICSIFQKDFFLDPTKLNNANVQIAGKLLGYGVYFADSCTKSMNYCRAQSTNDIGCLILNEVALGKQSPRNNPDYDITKASLAKTGCHSAHGVGQYVPSDITVIDGLAIPNGKIVDTKKKTYLKYNEFVVYDVDQILIRYLILVKNIGNYSM